VEVRKERGMSILNNPAAMSLLIPFGAFLMAIIIVAITQFAKVRRMEVQAHSDLRVREMEHERRIKELEVEKVKIELEKARIVKSGEPVAR
jgi:hypothetical protein